jgi:hypothetical protein
MYYPLRNSFDLQGPACRSPICSEKLFTRAAFMPSDTDLLPGNLEAASDVEMEDHTISAKVHKGKGRAKPKKPKRAARCLVLDSDDIIVSDVESDDEEVDDEMSDLIVESDEDEEEKDARRELKKRLGKRKVTVVLDSDEEMEDTPEESEVLFGRKAPVSDGVVKLMPRFLPSTKMKVCLTARHRCCILLSFQHMMEQLRKLVEERPDEKVCARVVFADMSNI